MSSQTIVLIAGANRGLGLETAKNLVLSDKTYHVILSSRNTTKATAAAATLRAHPSIKGSISTVQLDVTADSSIAAAKAHIEATFSRLDILVHNAAIYSLTPSLDLNTLRASLETNLLGVGAVTESFLPLLRKSKLASPRLVLVSSSNGSLAYNSDPESPHGGTYASEYRIAKAALNMLLVQYHASLKDITVLGVDPGFCATEAIGDADALRRRGAAEPEVGGRVIARVIRGEEGVPGRVVGPPGVLPW
ncbi:hypothetical protein BJY00DRAFT_322335 [Aspergillus carlsbadensis]|nr:hypothetical protein BJY00DRAFT_322335 [Aspergillus carlsbadensis]